MTSIKSRGGAVLDECLDRLLQGESVAQCLERYPDQAAELAPALEAASRLLQEASGIVPEEGFQRQTRQRLLYAFAQRRSQPVNRRWLPSWQPRLAAVMAALLLFMVVGLGSTYSAAADSVPGEPLYWVKERSERVRLILARSPEAQAHLNARLAEERAEEGYRVVTVGRAKELEGLEKRFRNRVHQALRSAGVYPGDVRQLEGLPISRRRQLWGELSQLLHQQAQRQVPVLQRHLRSAPPAMEPHLRRLLLTVEQEYQQAFQALEALEEKDDHE